MMHNDVPAFFCNIWRLGGFFSHSLFQPKHQTGTEAFPCLIV